MSRAALELRGLAKAVMASETSDHPAASEERCPALNVAEKLRPHLANLMGIGGFQALLSRALVLAKEEIPWLARVEVNMSGRLEGLERHHFPIAYADYHEGCAVLLASLFGLLVAFIGSGLMLQQINEIWPDIAMVTVAGDIT